MIGRKVILLAVVHLLQSTSGFRTEDSFEMAPEAMQFAEIANKKCIEKATKLGNKYCPSYGILNCEELVQELCE